MAARATPLLVAAVRASGARTVLLPGLYCPEIAEALSDAGFTLRYYDLDASLMPNVDHIVTKEAALIWYHPFGLYRPPPPGARLIVDACHALRTLISRPAWPGVTVVSFRKELGWSTGAAAAGLAIEDKAEDQAAVRRRVRHYDFTSAVARGRAATDAAEARLGRYLPPLNAGDILTHLPLLSGVRDSVIARLRRSSIDAWRWLPPMPNADPEQLPTTVALRSRLLLVPLPTLPAASELVKIIEQEDLLPWADAAGMSEI